MSKTYPGVYIDKLSNGKNNYRASITCNKKHVSLGSYSSASLASKAYLYAKKFLENEEISPESYKEKCPLSFEKYVILCNLKANNIYINTPIYLQKNSFHYYISVHEYYIFDMDDLFYLSSHKLMKRGNHLFVADYGAQVSIHERFNIRPFAVLNRDYRFMNDNDHDYRRQNIEIINPYYGVVKKESKTKTVYVATLHIHGNYVIGKYNDALTAAIAYNKAIDIVHQNKVNKKFPQNYIEGISPKEYAEKYTNIKISDKIINYRME